MVEEDRINASAMLNMQSKSPRSLQAKNTKNLSLNIKDNKITVSDLTNVNSVPLLTTKPLVVANVQLHMPRNSSSTNLKHSSSPISKRNDASIYSLPKSVCTSPLYGTRKCRSNSNLSSLSSRSGRIHSSSLSVKTKELECSSSARSRSKTVSSALETSTPQVECNQQKNTWIIPNNMGSAISQASNGQERLDADEKMSLDYSEVYKENAYPNGPLMVIPPNVYLYSEPSLEGVMNFDVVINVAKEIMNFRDIIPDERKIDYYHIPWTHNSKISYDLDYLTEVIHKAIGEGKKILIHCQCGVSRSASLVVAYIMRYQHKSLNDAYTHVKHIAKDISPNMGLIFQLMEWNEKFLKSREAGSTINEDLGQRTHSTLDGKQAREPAEEGSNLGSYGLPIPKSSSQKDLSLSPETTPRALDDYFKSTSASSASTSSSTIVEGQSNIESMSLSSDLEKLLPRSSETAATNESQIWS